MDRHFEDVWESDRNTYEFGIENSKVTAVWYFSSKLHMQQAKLTWRWRLINPNSESGRSLPWRNFSQFSQKDDIDLPSYIGMSGEVIKIDVDFGGHQLYWDAMKSRHTSEGEEKLRTGSTTQCVQDKGTTYSSLIEAHFSGEMGLLAFWRKLHGKIVNQICRPKLNWISPCQMLRKRYTSGYQNKNKPVSVKICCDRWFSWAYIMNNLTYFATNTPKCAVNAGNLISPLIYEAEVPSKESGIHFCNLIEWVFRDLVFRWDNRFSSKPESVHVHRWIR
jgi:hypothetical protein